MLQVSKFLVPNGYAGITIYPFVFLKSEKHKEDKILINHEKIHLQQQKELLLVFFYLIYGLHFLFNYLKFRNWSLAYRNICFEKEAYENQANQNYLNERKIFAYWRK